MRINPVLDHRGITVLLWRHFENVLKEQKCQFFNGIIERNKWLIVKQSICFVPLTYDLEIMASLCKRFEKCPWNCPIFTIFSEFSNKEYSRESRPNFRESQSRKEARDSREETLSDTVSVLFDASTVLSFFNTQWKTLDTWICLSNVLAVRRVVHSRPTTANNSNSKSLWEVEIHHRVLTNWNVPLVLHVVLRL